MPYRRSERSASKLRGASDNLSAACAVVSRRCPFFSISCSPKLPVISTGNLAKKASKKVAKKAAKKKKKTARNAPAYALSKELAAIVGATELSRTETTKKVWDYIKKHNLQDPNNKRLIVPDEKLSKVFGNEDPIDMMKLAGVLSKHINV